MDFKNKVEFPNVQGYERMNTTNAWGFGGWNGYRYNLKDGSYADIGRMSFRHMPDERYERFFKKVPPLGYVQISKQEFYELASEMPIKK